MPVLKQERTEKRVVLPSSTPEDQAWVIIYTDIRTGDIFPDALSGEVQRSTSDIVSRLIKEWNFTKPDGNKAEINAEYVALMDAVDLVYILKESGLEEKMKPFADAKKKNSSSTSQPSQT